MGRPKRNALAAATESTTPPDELSATQSLACVVKAEARRRFRNTIWVKRGGYVLVDLRPTDDVKERVDGEIVNVVREEKLWRKQRYWPKEFAQVVYSDEEEEESNVGKMPPSDSEDDE